MDYQINEINLFDPAAELSMFSHTRDEKTYVMIYMYLNSEDSDQHAGCGHSLMLAV